MKAYKEKQFIIFELDDKSTVKYDLSTGETYGKKGAKVKDLRTQLRGYTLTDVINSFEDKKYGEFLDKIRRRYDRISNIGSLLCKAWEHSNLEQFYAMGFNNVDSNLTYKVSDVPKGLIKLCLNNNFYLDNNAVLYYKKHPDIYNNLLNMEYTTIEKRQIFRLLSIQREWSWAKDQYVERYLKCLIETYNYNPISLVKYLDNLMTYEAIENLDNLISELIDYNRMMAFISPKYDKYPKHFLTTHRIASRNYNRLKVVFKEEEFKARIDKNYEYSYKDYKIIYPSCTQDIKDEAVQLNHCVASYIDRVISGDCHILFLRKKNDLGNSLVTLEIRKGKVVQSAGRFNRQTTQEENLVIEKYNNYLKNKLEGLKNVS